MNRHELALLVKRDGFDTMRTRVIEKILQTAEKIILEATLERSERVSLLGFGSFHASIRAPYNKVTSLRGERKVVPVPQRKRLSFKVARKHIYNVE